MSGESSACGDGPGRCADGRGRRWEENPQPAGQGEPQRSKSSGRDWSNSKYGTGSGSAGSKAGVRCEAFYGLSESIDALESAPTKLFIRKLDVEVVLDREQQVDGNKGREAGFVQIAIARQA